MVVANKDQSIMLNALGSACRNDACFFIDITVPRNLHYFLKIAYIFDWLIAWEIPNSLFFGTPLFLLIVM